MKQSSIYQRVVEINMARSSHPWMNLFSLKMWRHRTSEKRLWHFESKNRSTAESRFGRPNSGDGIAEENMKKIFDPLFTTKQHGTGLGLSSVRAIIASLGGTLAGKAAAT